MRPNSRASATSSSGGEMTGGFIRKWQHGFVLVELTKGGIEDFMDGLTQTASSGPYSMWHDICTADLRSSRVREEVRVKAEGGMPLEVKSNEVAEAGDYESSIFNTPAAAGWARCGRSDAGNEWLMLGNKNLVPANEEAMRQRRECWHYLKNMLKNFPNFMLVAKYLDCQAVVSAVHRAKPLPDELAVAASFGEFSLCFRKQGESQVDFIARLDAQVMALDVEGIFVTEEMQRRVLLLGSACHAKSSGDLPKPQMTPSPLWWAVKDIQRDEESRGAKFNTFEIKGCPYIHFDPNLHTPLSIHS